MTRNYQVLDLGGAPVKHWTNGVYVEGQALLQLSRVAKLPFIFKHLAAMPDVHWGLGATVGSVIATKGAIVPAAIGVDIGCGMQAVKLDMKLSDLPSLPMLRNAIERAVPHGRTDNGGPNDRGAWGHVPDRVFDLWNPDITESLGWRWAEIIDETPELEIKNTARHLGTLGTGNHFIEVQADQDDNVWLMLHSGSRGPGAKIASIFIRRAKAHMQRWHVDLPDPELAFLPEGEKDFGLYIKAMLWAQDFARTNRDVMMDAVIGVVADYPEKVAFRFDCHHNFAAKENHFGQNVWVTRKGATRARAGEYGIIPGSMGTGSFIVKGKGNPDSFMSCSHGAGRAMSRTQAKKTITIEDHCKAVEGIECRRDSEVLDESPAAYKDISAVIAAQEDLISVETRLRTIINVKG